MLSKREKSFPWRLLAVAAVISITGCAGAYHDYQGCCVPYLYCTPPPLPYVSYEGCHCPTPGASLYFQQNGSPDPIIPEADAPMDAPTRPELGGTNSPGPE
jgi:hypothetical protein